MFRILRWGLLWFVAVTAYAQTHDVVYVLKTYGYWQSDATTQTPGRCYLSVSGQTRITGAGLSGALVGTSGSLPVTVASDGTFSGNRYFATAASMNAAFPDGNYILAIAGNGLSFSTQIPIYTGTSITPVLISNYAALQSWPVAQALAPIWAAIPGATIYDYISVAAYDPTGAVLEDQDYDTTGLLATDTTATFATLPANEELEVDLVYGQEKIYTSNAGATYLYIDIGFDLGMSAFVKSPPAIVSQPTGSSLIAGNGFSLSVTASSGSTAPLTYQWYKDGTAIPGATAATYQYSDALVSDSGNYTVVVANSGGTATSSAAQITVTPYDPGRIVNLSITTLSGTGDQTLAAGFVIAAGVSGAPGGQAILVRGIGPTLGSFGVPGTMLDPTLQLIPSGTTTPLATNDDWGGDPTLAAETSAVGAFPLAPASADAVVFQPSLAPGGYSALVAGKNGGTGVALAEIYDATAAGTYTPSSPRLINVSGRAQVSASNILTGGFTIGGTTNLTVLIRASGPALSAFGLAGLATPSLALFKAGSTVPVMTNTAWGGTPALSTAFNATGAFGWSATSNDCALLVTLPPGGYTAQISALNGNSGTALLEIYEAP